MPHVAEQSADTLRDAFEKTLAGEKLAHSTRRAPLDHPLEGRYYDPITEMKWQYFRNGWIANDRRFPDA